jgi:hypothetical protein
MQLILAMKEKRGGQAKAAVAGGMLDFCLDLMLWLLNCPWTLAIA